MRHVPFPHITESLLATRSEPDLGEGCYLTDGVHLYRVVVGDDGCGVVALEDCQLLAIVLVPTSDLGQLRGVLPAA